MLPAAAAAFTGTASICVAGRWSAAKFTGPSNGTPSANAGVPPVALTPETPTIPSDPPARARTSKETAKFFSYAPPLRIQPAHGSIVITPAVSEKHFGSGASAVQPAVGCKSSVHTSALEARNVVI